MIIYLFNIILIDIDSRGKEKQDGTFTFELEC